MRQRVAIALATVFHPCLIIADEPTTALDVVVTAQAYCRCSKDIQSDGGNTVLLVTHDMAVHANVANRVMIMYAGRIAEEGANRCYIQCAASLHPTPDPFAANDWG